MSLSNYHKEVFDKVVNIILQYKVFTYFILYLDSKLNKYNFWYLILINIIIIIIYIYNSNI